MNTTLVQAKHYVHNPTIKNTRTVRRIIFDTPDTLFVRRVKRGTDVLIASLLTVTILSWLTPLLFIAIKLSSRGPLFFRQQRIGLNGRTFSCLKFRTMRINEHSDIRQASADDKRITRLGLWLRITHIDELPQLFNVLMNDMSIVGPRPHMLYHDELFSSMLPDYRHRHLLKPGITGLAQATGRHGATPDFQSISDRTRLDLFYVRKVSFLLDMKILLRTLFAVKSRA
ncbi:sugar transferase [Taibaiella soli]|uniref:Bacterial sugar transferase domain-containing protein n=1 Tax=Taibaiella soli TaxID=1649169 RepID=A0A2W2B4E3_9BACT|nr:sugar transferase [Taibaiella soli]PZF74928.1 hypothetical protein DN068_01655 [Taibaiella soli]